MVDFQRGDADDVPPMQRVAAILMMLCYAGLGTGVMEYWHNQQHASEDAIQVLATNSSSKSLPHTPVHTDLDCAVHGQLHLAGFTQAWVPLLICLGVFVAFLTMLRSGLAAQEVVFAIPCRGPPAA